MAVPPTRTAADRDAALIKERLEILHGARGPAGDRAVRLKELDTLNATIAAERKKIDALTAQVKTLGGGSTTDLSTIEKQIAAIQKNVADLAAKIGSGSTGGG